MTAGLGMPVKTAGTAALAGCAEANAATAQIAPSRALRVIDLIRETVLLAPHLDGVSSFNSGGREKERLALAGVGAQRTLKESRFGFERLPAGSPAVAVAR